MASAKLLLLPLVVIGFGYYMYIPLPDDYDQKSTVITVCVFKKIILPVVGLVGRLFLGHKHDYDTMRYVFPLFLPETNNTSDPDLQIFDDVFGSVPVRVYRPKGAPVPSPVLMHFHGGGWSTGSIDGEDKSSRYYAKRANVVVVAVEYRLAPEYPFPASLDDCVTATVHVLSGHGNQLGLDPKRVAVIGVSAGGNLAATVPLRLLDPEFESLPPLTCQVMISPCLQGIDFSLPSYLRNEHDGVLTRWEMARFYLSYAGVDIGGDTVTQALNGQHIRKTTRSSLEKYIHPDLITDPKGTVTRDAPDEGGAVNETLALLAEPALTNYLLAPILAPDDILKRVPRALVLLAHYDVLHDDALLYVRRLINAGVDVTSHVLKSGNHMSTVIMFDKMEPQTQVAQEAYDAVFKFIADYL